MDQRYILLKLLLLKNILFGERKCSKPKAEKGHFEFANYSSQTVFLQGVFHLFRKARKYRTG